VTPASEICDGLDNDCDGDVDEGFDVGKACDNGDSGPCHKVGKMVCDSTGRGTLCNAPPAIKTEEICDGFDNDCDGEIDEGKLPGVGGKCGSPVGECKQGTTSCTDGKLTCSDVGPNPESCDGLDNDCDGSVDEGLPMSGQECRPVGLPPGPIQGECRPGKSTCLGKDGWACQGGVLPAMEICDGKDNDCNGIVDDGMLCPQGFACAAGECVPLCRSEEVASCPADRSCRDGVCIRKACAVMPCTGSQYCNSEGRCVDLCAGVTCPGGTRCERGLCVDCHNSSERCPVGQVCRLHDCAPDPCAGVNCGVGTYCRNGTCVKQCPVSCPDGQMCREGACVPDKCAARSCGLSEFCDPADGQCKHTECGSLQCMLGLACVAVTGKCELDPCMVTRCRGNEVCSVLPEGIAQCERSLANRFGTRLAASGGGLGTCACRLGAAEEGRSAGGAAWLALLAVLAIRRRRR
jgi:MYXO-CTERM domain-containing protein